MAKLPPGSAYFGSDTPEGALPPTPVQGGSRLPPSPPPMAPSPGGAPAGDDMSLLAERAGITLPDVATASPAELIQALQAMGNVATTDGEFMALEALADEWGIPSPFGENFGPQEQMDERAMMTGKANAGPDQQSIADQIDPSLGADLRFYPSSGREGY